MNNINKRKPVVLVIAGHDPCGGAGIQADIESISATGCYAITAITALTAQNTTEFNNVYPVDPEYFKQQLITLTNEIKIDACKIGMLGNAENIPIIEKILMELDIPVILDPVLVSETGIAVSSAQIVNIMIDKLLPLVSLITPNSIEARELSKSDDLEAAANSLIEYGCKGVLITGTHEDTPQVINTLYQISDKPLEYKFQRLPGIFHGSGCTLSSSIAANMALGTDLKTAIEMSLNYTWNTLDKGIKLGKGQFHPDRFFTI